MDRLSVVIIFYVVCCLGYQANGQNYSIYNNYFVNPFIYNPAEAATSHSRFNLNHRQQWMGFNEAPKVTTATFTTLIDDSRAAVGFKASNFTRGILKTTELQFSYAYAIPVDLENFFFLGLSGGCISNNIDLTYVDTTDPAIRNYLSGNLQPSGNFGALYRTASGINVGITIPYLFQQQVTNTSHFENAFNTPGNDVMISAYYKRKLDAKYAVRRGSRHKKRSKNYEAIAPLEFYSLFRYSRDWGTQAEGIVKLNVSDACWLAGGYRQNYGLIGSLGFQLSNNISISYAYEPGSNLQPNYSPGSHEIQVGFQLGKLKKLRKPTPILQSIAKGPSHEEHTARFQQAADEVAEIEVTGTRKEYYVVIRGFGDFTAADDFKTKLRSQKFKAQVFYLDKDKKYYVYVFSSPHAAKAHQEARNLKNFTKLKEARVLTVETKE